MQSQALKKVKGLEAVPNQALSNERIAEKDIALCIIDGTRTTFSTNYIAQGEEGGRKAGQDIVWVIKDYLSNDNPLQEDWCKLSIAIFVIRNTQLRNLVTSTPEKFDEFFAGLNQTPHSLINIIEVDNKRAALSKIDANCPASRVLHF